MKVLVTGATGFIGNYVIDELLRHKIEVIATSTNEGKARSASWYPKVIYIEYQIGPRVDINLYEYFKKPDKIIHLAWKGLPNYNQPFHIEENLWYDYRFLKNLIVHGCTDLTITGTCFEYGMVEGCLVESMVTDPQNSYAIAKDTLRKFLVELQKNVHFDLKWVRLFYMYGEGQNPKSLIAQLNKALENGDAVFNMSGGEQIRDYLPVEVVSQNILYIALHSSLYGVINNCSGNPVKLIDFVNNYLANKGQKIGLNLGYYPYSELEPMAFWGCKEKLDSAKNKL